MDSTIRVWDLREGRLLLTASGHSAGVAAVKFSDNGEFIASGGHDQTVLTWRSNFDADCRDYYTELETGKTLPKSARAEQEAPEASNLARREWNFSTNPHTKNTIPEPVVSGRSRRPHC